MLGNRIRKNFKHRRKWARRQDISCFRVYDHDIPEFPLSVDFLQGKVAVRLGRNQHLDAGAVGSLAEALGVQEGDVYWNACGRTLSHQVQECGHHFQLELGRAFDYGLFLDHRNLRAQVQEQISGRSFLNLFCYTASFSVYAAAGGAAKSVSVDLSKANLEWAQANFTLNGLSPEHGIVRDDAMAFVKNCGENFDIIVCDPPTFSNSKRAERDFDVQRSHRELLGACLGLLNPGGTLYFSNNSRKFRLHDDFSWALEITAQTIPEDFKRRPSHRCWKFETV